VEKVMIGNYSMVSPTPIVLVGTMVDNKANYLTVGAFGVVCLAPVFYISLKNTHYSTTGIKESGFFSVNLPSAAMLPKTDYCGMVSGGTTDKSALFTSFYDERGNAPMIQEAPMNYLCKVMNSVTINDFEVFFGEIISAYVNDDCVTDGKPDPLKIDPIIGMGAAYYSLGNEAGKVFTEGKSEEFLT